MYSTHFLVYNLILGFYFLCFNAQKTHQFPRTVQRCSLVSPLALF